VSFFLRVSEYKVPLPQGCGRGTLYFSTENLTNFIQEKIKSELEQKSQILATKEDLTKVEKRIDQSKVEMIKWMFAFWVTIVLMFIGLYIKN
jgi:hypothetical protein